MKLLFFIVFAISLCLFGIAFSARVYASGGDLPWLHILCMVLHAIMLGVNVLTMIDELRRLRILQ